MSFEAGLVSYLETCGNLTDLIGTRIYPNRMSEGCALPALVYQLVGGREQHIGRYQEPYIQLTVWADDFDDLAPVDAQLYEALEGYHGMMGALHVRVYATPPLDGEEPDTGLSFRRRQIRPFYKQPLP